MNLGVFVILFKCLLTGFDRVDRVSLVDGLGEMVDWVISKRWDGPLYLGLGD